MTPIRVVAHLESPVALDDGWMHLDSLLASVVALRDNLPPCYSEADVIPIEIPLEREPGGRFHLCSVSQSEWELSETRYLQRRFPVAEAQAMSRMRKTFKVGAGATKSYRIPYEVRHAQSLAWWAVGDPEGVRSLLLLAGHLGKKRSVGNGRVSRWDVEPVESTWPGFPIMTAEGKPLRPLPEDWPGLVDPPIQHYCLTYPYWLRSREAVLAVPERC